MITVYTYKGKFGDDLPLNYIPCLIGNDEDDGEAYFETIGEVTAAEITATKVSRWFAPPTKIVAVRFNGPDGNKLGYALADELLTAGVDL